MSPLSCLFYLCVCLLFLCPCKGLSSPKYASQSPGARFRAEKQPQPRAFILSLPRSGSTFTGSLFLENPESAYLYESTRSLGNVFVEDKCAEEPEHNVSQVISDMFACNFTTLQDYIEDISVGMSDESKHLYSWGHIERNSAPYRCSAANPNKTMFAAKEIITWGPKLKWLLKTVGPSLRIIWLVRDIRGFVSSFIPFKDADKRENMYYSWKLNTRDLWMPYDNCRWVDESQKAENWQVKALLRDQTATAYKRVAAWWIMEQRIMMNFLSELPAENWMLVRYEDLSLYPIEITQQIYNFLGKQVVHENVINFLLESTHGGEDDGSSTNRDSAKMSTAYLSRIPEDVLEDIETMAGPLMDYFGYGTSPLTAPKKQPPSMYFRT